MTLKRLFFNLGEGWILNPDAAALLLLVCLLPSSGCSSFLACHQSNPDVKVVLSGDKVSDTSISLKLPGNKTWADVAAGHGRECLTNGPITVLYPPGYEEAARSVAAEMVKLRQVVEERTGIAWPIHLYLVLLETETKPNSLRIEAFSKGRELAFPIFIVHGRTTLPEIAQDNVFFPGMLVHEITEHALTNPPKGHPPFLCDLGILGIDLSHGTRWYRDGCAEFARIAAQEASATQLKQQTDEDRAVALSSLNRIGKDLLGWSNNNGNTWRGHSEGDLYAAALGMAWLISERFGPDALSKIMTDIRRYPYVTGQRLAESVQRVTGSTPSAIITSHHFPWVGVTWRTEWLAGARKWTVQEVEPQSPAEKAGLAVGDELLTVDGKTFKEYGEVLVILGSKKPGDAIELGLKRKGEQITIRPIPATRPPNWSARASQKKAVGPGKDPSDYVRVNSTNSISMSITTKI